MFRRSRAVFLTLTLALLPGVLGGCEFDRAAGPPAPTLADAAAAYSRQNYAAAYQIAAPRAKKSGQAGDQAAFIAGMSAKSLGHPDQAEHYLTQAAGARDDRTAGDAGASLGLLYAEHGRYARSAKALLQATSHLRGEDQAQAYFYAAAAQQKLGRWAQARTNLVLARGRTKDVELRRQVSEQLAVTGYTIQVGAFQDRDNAKRLAEQLADSPTAKEVGDPRLVTTSGNRGQAMYLVQIGRFATFSAANHVRTQVGRDTAIIVPLAGKR